MEIDRDIKILIVASIIALIIGLTFIFNVDFDSKECSNSKYNTSNRTSALRFFGECYVPKNIYEDSCFKLKTGEEC